MDCNANLLDINLRGYKFLACPQSSYSASALCTVVLRNTMCPCCACDLAVPLFWLSNSFDIGMCRDVPQTYSYTLLMINHNLYQKNVLVLLINDGWLSGLFEEGAHGFQKIMNSSPSFGVWKAHIFITCLALSCCTRLPLLICYKLFDGEWRHVHMQLDTNITAFVGSWFTQLLLLVHSNVSLWSGFDGKIVLGKSAQEWSTLHMRQVDTSLSVSTK